MQVNRASTEQLRWDKADLNAYCYSTGEQLHPYLVLLNDLLDNYTATDNKSIFNPEKNIDKIYYDIVNTLATCAYMYVPKCKL